MQRSKIGKKVKFTILTQLVSSDTMLMQKFEKSHRLQRAPTFLFTLSMRAFPFWLSLTKILFLNIQVQYWHTTDLCFIHNPFQTVFFLCKLTTLSKLKEPNIIKCYIFFKPYMCNTKIYNKHLLDYKNVTEYILLCVMTLHSENELAFQFPLLVHYI